jgi:hypothetical protein
MLLLSSKEFHACQQACRAAGVQMTIETYAAWRMGELKPRSPVKRAVARVRKLWRRLT